MGGLSIWHWMIVLVVVMLLFGTGKVSSLMGDMAKGIKTFKKTMAEDDASMTPPAERQAATIAPPGPTVTATSAETATAPIRQG
jgi:sec-independent protein translocase protein TatA